MIADVIQGNLSQNDTLVSALYQLCTTTLSLNSAECPFTKTSVQWSYIGIFLGKWPPPWRSVNFQSCKKVLNLLLKSWGNETLRHKITYNYSSWQHQKWLRQMVVITSGPSKLCWHCTTEHLPEAHAALPAATLIPSAHSLQLPRADISRLACKLRDSVRYRTMWVGKDPWRSSSPIPL